MTNKRKRNNRRQRLHPTPEAQQRLPSQSTTSIHHAPIGQETPPYDHALLERAKNQWLVGDWDNLARIDPAQILEHPHRAQAILLAASAHQHRGDSAAARKMAELAKNWGCNREHLARVLVSNVYETLGRARLRANDPHRAKRHFNTALRLMTPGVHTDSIARTRLLEHTSAQDILVGLRTNKLETTHLANQDKIQDTYDYLRNPRFDANAYAFYQNLTKAQQPPPFLLLDSKSLPRAGLHYLKNTLSRLLPGQFSFCEWYQEVGCCRRMPCALKGYAQACQRSNQFKLRMIKSHDFSLDDAAFPALPNVQRVVLIRNPLFVLTSWFELEQLHRYHDALKAESIDIKKIWLLHEPEITASAINVLDRVYEPLEDTALTRWLHVKSLYIAGFMEKWVYPGADSPRNDACIVQYEDIDSFASYIAENQRAPGFSDRNSLSRSSGQHLNTSFRPRRDPFSLRSEKVAAFVDSHRAEFRAAASFITQDERYERATETVDDSCRDR